MIKKYLPAWSVIDKLLLFLIVALLIGILVWIVLGPIGFNLLGGILLMSGILGLTIVGAAALLVGSLVQLNAQEKDLEAERAQLEAARARLAAKKATRVQLEAKQAQLVAEKAEIEAKKIELEVKNAELDVQEAKVEAKRIELEKKAVEVNAYAAEVDTRYKQLTVEKRRFSVWKKRMESEKAQVESKLVELKTIHGKIPKKEGCALAISFLEVIKAEDPALMENMFSNPFGFTEAPRPLKQPDNPLHALLTEGVEAKRIEATDLEAVTCPISSLVMQDPVIGEDGRTYDRFCLENIYLALPGTYPFNRQAMKVDPAQLPPDSICQSKIQQLVQQCQVQPSASEAEEDPRASFGMTV